MEELICWQLDKFPLSLKFKVHLEYFDGPLLSLFENEYGESYLYSWCDVDDFHNRWLIFRITKKTLKGYIEGDISLRELILNPVDGLLYSLEIDHSLRIVNTSLIQPEHLPVTYIPELDSYYSFSELNRETREEDIFMIQEILDYGKYRFLFELLKDILEMPRKERTTTKSMNKENLIWDATHSHIKSDYGLNRKEKSNRIPISNNIAA